MPVDYQTITGTITLPDVETEITTFSPGADELWYCDVVRTECEGDGGYGTNVSIKFGVRQGLTANVLSPVSSASVRDTNVESAAASVGEYLADTETYVIYTDGDANTAPTLHYTAQLRRVL